MCSRLQPRVLRLHVHVNVSPWRIATLAWRHRCGQRALLFDPKGEAKHAELAPEDVVKSRARPCGRPETQTQTQPQP